MNEQVQSELKKIFSGRFSTSESTRANYARGEDTYDPVLSKAVNPRLSVLNFVSLFTFLYFVLLFSNRPLRHF